MKKAMFLLSLVMLSAHMGFCATDLVIIGDKTRKVSLDLSQLKAGNSGPETVFKTTLINDLLQSGWFSMSAAGSGAITVSGHCSLSGGRLMARCAAINQSTGKKYLSKQYDDMGSGARALAHMVSDELVWAIKRVKGIARSRIVMVGSRNGRKDVFVCDADGQNISPITSDGVVCLSPSWWPDSQAIVYTSFCGGFPDVYKITFGAQTRRMKLSGYPGLNSGADISPDGRKMALTLSKSGNPELYVMDLRNNRLKRMTKTRLGAEASPSWSPDGKSIVYVSDTSGAPQLYVVSASGGQPKRITFFGTQNVGPDWGPDGRIVYASRRDGKFQICVIDPATGAKTQLTNDHVEHEDPSWAPDSRHVVYTHTRGYSSNLYVLDTLGDPPVRLTTLNGDWYSSDWMKY